MSSDFLFSRSLQSEGVGQKVEAAAMCHVRGVFFLTLVSQHTLIAALCRCGSFNVSSSLSAGVPGKQTMSHYDAQASEN